MKITKKVAAATLVPAAVAGITISSLAVASAADQPAGQAAAASVAGQARHAGQAAPNKVKHKAERPKHTGTSAAKAVNRVRLAKVKAYAAAHAKAQHAKAHQAKPAPAQAAPSSTSMFAGMSSFERCVAWRESGNNPTASSAGLFGILPSTWASLGYPGTAGTSSVALQKQAFDRLYAQYGTSPWAPYDGC
jgi:hypothetical protein